MPRVHLSDVVTTNQVRLVRREDRWFEERYELWRLKGEAGEDFWDGRRRAADDVARFAHVRGVVSVVNLDDHSTYAMARPGTEVAAGVPGAVRAGWGSLTDRELIRLVLNACATLEFFDDGEANDTGRYVRLRPGRDGKGAGDTLEIVGIEVGVSPDMNLSLAVRTFTKRSAVLADAHSRGDVKRMAGAAKAPGYVRTESGTLRHLNCKDDYVEMKLPDLSRNGALFTPVDTLDQASPRPFAKLDVLVEALERIHERFGEAVGLEFARHERISQVVRSSGNAFKRELASHSAGRRVHVSAGTDSCAAAVAGLCGCIAAAGADAVAADGVIDGEWNVVIVADEHGEDDGYEPAGGRCVQHVSLGLATGIADDPRVAQSVVGSILKELWVKQCVVEGAVSGPEWERTRRAVGGGLTFACLLVDGYDGRDNARTIAGTRLCTLALEDDGSLSYSERTLLATLGDGEGYSACSHLIRVDGKGQVWPERERTYVRFADGSETLIEPTDLYTLPNQLKKMFADMNDGKRARTGERRNLYLSPLCGIGSFVDGGFVYYFVGNDTHFNTTVRRAAPIRRMWCVSGVDHSGELLALMDVGFVRYVRQTVLPYPVKMLREFWSMRRGMGDDRRP